MNLDPDPLYTEPDPEPVQTWTDSAKLRLLALWFDKWDRTDYADRQRLLDDGPGHNEVQADLRRMARRFEHLDSEPVPWRRTDTAYVVSVVLILAVSLAIGFMRWK